MSDCTLFSVADAFPDIMEALNQQPKEIQTGISALDEELVTISGKYISVAGETSTGKTDFCVSVAVNRIRTGNPVLFASIEVGEHAMLRRFASHFANAFAPGIDAAFQTEREIKSLTPEQQAALNGGVERFEQCKQFLYLYDGSDQFGGKEMRVVEHVAVKAKEISRKHCVPCLVVCDYFQLLATRESTGTATEKFDALSHKLAQLAHETGSPVIVPCATNKDGSIRGSGQVNYDNDITLHLSIDKSECSEDDLPMMAVRPMVAHVSKNRDGRARARVKLDYRPASHRFTDRGGEL